jgi:hypothetical protein
LRGSHNLAIHDQRGSAIVVEGRNSQNCRHAKINSERAV